MCAYSSCQFNVMKITDPAFNYDTFGQSYSVQRQTEPEIEKQINKALRDAYSVINVGAGTGSYEPDDRYLIAVEPSVTMRAQRLIHGKVPAINATADALPFDEGVFDAATAFLTVHHWSDIPKRLNKIRRVTHGKIIIPGTFSRFTG